MVAVTYTPQVNEKHAVMNANNKTFRELLWVDIVPP